MDKLYTQGANEKCSGCGQLTEDGYIVFGEKGKNKFLCKQCSDGKQLKKKISITVRESQDLLYQVLQLFGVGKVYEVINQKNIMLPKLIPEIQLQDLMNSNIEVIIK